MFQDKELEAHRLRRLDAFVEMEPMHPATRLKELDRVYRELEKIYDSRVEFLDKLQGQNGQRGARGEYYFPTVMHAANAIRKMRDDIIDINVDIHAYELKMQRRSYGQFVEDEINSICETYKIEGVKTL